MLLQIICYGFHFDDALLLLEIRSAHNLRPNSMAQHTELRRTRRGREEWLMRVEVSSKNVSA